MTTTDRTLRQTIACAILALSSVHAATTYTDFTSFSTSAGTLTTETFDLDKANNANLSFDGGITSAGLLPAGTPDHNIASGLFHAHVRHPSDGNGYQTLTWTFPTAVTAFGADFGSIAGSRALSIVGNFDGSGDISYNLRTEIGAGGFFGVIGSSAFTSITFQINTAEATIQGNDLFTVDNVSIDSVPEPSTVIFSAIGSLALLTRRRRS